MNKSLVNNKRTTSMMSFLALAMCFLALMTTMPTAHATAQNSSKSHTPNATEFHVGDTVTFTTTVSVLDFTGGPALSISNLTITDPLPVGETFIIGTNTSTPSSSFTAYPNGTLFWNFGRGPFETTPQAVVSYSIIVTSNVTAGRAYNIATYSYDETLSGAHSAPAISDRIFIAPALVGGYSVSIEAYAASKPLAPYLALTAMLAVGLLAIKRKIPRRNKRALCLPL